MTVAFDSIRLDTTITCDIDIFSTLKNKTCIKNIVSMSDTSGCAGERTKIKRIEFLYTSNETLFMNLKL